MKAFHDAATDAHDPKFFLVRGRLRANEERPARAALLLEGLAQIGASVETPSDAGMGPIAAVHSLDYLRFLRDAWSEWRAQPDAGDEVIANVHPLERTGAYPDSVVGRAGWHMADTACPIGEGTWTAAVAAANVAVAAADALGDGVPYAYALCRPPGHHAYAAVAGGHCFLNNAAIAAERLLRRVKRVAILDIDVHHGNGTQGVFYRRSDVFTLSIHADPNRFYPFFYGHAAERGEGDGAGYALNMPLPLGAGDADWLAAIEQAVRELALFAPEAVVLSLGLDAHENDPLRGLAVTTDGFRRAGALLAQIREPMAMIQEGGYLSDDLSRNLAAFLSGYLDARGA